VVDSAGITGFWRTDAESAEKGAEDAEKGKGDLWIVDELRSGTSSRSGLDDSNMDVVS
jgi:hypothetical protein